jgi:hypothetical protein
MKQSRVFILLIVFASACVCAQGQTQRYSQSKDKVSLADFPLTVHVTSSRFSPTEHGVLLVDAEEGGKQIRLETNGLRGLLPTGDFKARVAKKKENADGTYFESYELLLKNGSHILFNEIGGGA